MDIKHNVGIRLESKEPEDLQLSQRLAERLDMVPSTTTQDDVFWYFSYRNGRLELHHTQKNPPVKPLCIDFLAGPSYYRFTHDLHIKQPLARAVGVKQGVRPRVVDATAGFGEDGFVLAALGCRVTALERSPIVWALLDDALRRASSHPKIGMILNQYYVLKHADARTYLRTSAETADTIYLDPMYPHTGRSALNKQKMRLLRALVGNDEDDIELLTAAENMNARRVVVKRPAQAHPIGRTTPSYTLKTKGSRFDIYLTPHL